MTEEIRDPVIAYATITVEADNIYLDNAEFSDQKPRESEFKKLLQNTKEMLLLSDYKYAMAALPLAVEPIQKIRFIPYAHQRFTRFLRAYHQRFGNDPAKKSDLQL